MSLHRVFFLFSLSGLLIGFMAGGKLAQSAEDPAFPDGPGKDVLMSRCFQCHNDRIWKNLHQDKTAWEGVLYRMMGRGALWTDDEIESMATYLSTVFGPTSGKTSK